ncbi:protease inhibitor I42 family protein [Lutimonas saemankumensis]|uniref:protease inhibitor I42 family protein n=1 Tax=Lutimonas saemankumensis TaxID=483016 RepID=UPI001CD4D2BF|nr:protease inhibitor I42 family protein [Lutimonas saemankumensis]MCA0933631.1 protease inhibitor I42 family protein [Lutimonas saemankumensis]
MKFVYFLIVIIPILCSCQKEPMKVKQGETFEIKLKSNRTTGYSWFLERGLKNSILDSVSVQYVIPENAATGAGGTEIWSFRARSKGEARLLFIYKRAWEKEGDQMRKEIGVKVE